ncbi:MAG: alpha/beta hydrolase [Patescibacteria group bacterium]
MAEMELCILNKNKEKLAGIFHKINDSKRVIIVCHGLMGGKDRNFIRSFCVFLNVAGFNAFRFDFSGNGESAGWFEDSKYTKEIEDLRAVIDYFHNDGFRKIGIVGHSQGGAICVLEAAEDTRIDFVISIAGVAYPQGFIQRFSGWNNISQEELRERLKRDGFIEYVKKDGRKFNLAKDFFDDMVGYHPIDKVKNIKAPILFIHGDQDNSIDIQESRDMLGVANEPKELFIVKGADHIFSDPEKEAEIVKKSVEWIESVLK